MRTTTLCALFVLIIFSVGATALVQEEDEVPVAPSHLRAFTRFDGAMGVAELSWHDESDNELGFEILRSDNGRDFDRVGMVGTNNTAYEDKVGRYVTGSFVYKVRAFNQAGPSQDSNIVSIWF